MAGEFASWVGTIKVLQQIVQERRLFETVQLIFFLYSGDQQSEAGYILGGVYA